MNEEKYLQYWEKAGEIIKEATNVKIQKATENLQKINSKFKNAYDNNFEDDFIEPKSK